MKQSYMNTVLQEAHDKLDVGKGHGQTLAIATERLISPPLIASSCEFNIILTRVYSSFPMRLW